MLDPIQDPFKRIFLGWKGQNLSFEDAQHIMLGLAYNHLQQFYLHAGLAWHVKLNAQPLAIVLFYMHA